MKDIYKEERNRQLIELNLDQQYLADQVKAPFEVAKMITGRCPNLYLYGGAVRNLLLGTQTVFPDFDFVGDFNLDEIEAKFRDLVVKRNDSVTTIKLKIGDTFYDFTSAKDIKERLSVNDFTISNICIAKDGTVVDHFGGIESLKKREIKIIDAEAKIQADPSRILRVFRFSSELDFDIEQETFRATLACMPLLESKRYLQELRKIVALKNDVKFKVLKTLSSYNVGANFDYENECLENIDIEIIEKQIVQKMPVEAINKIFEAETYLVGGATRDMIFGRNSKDWDIRVKKPFEEILACLEDSGYIRTQSRHATEGQFYVNETFKAIRVVINGVDIDVTEMKTTDIESMVRKGDINFSCCVYNVVTGKIENTDLISEIREKKLVFCNPEKALNDPLIVINALKQISRIPDVQIPPETEVIIKASMPKIIDFIKANPNLKYKISSFCGNINSEQVYLLFGENSKELFDDIDLKKTKLKTSERYVSQTLSELSVEDRNQIIQLLRRSFGDKYDESKELPDKINSVVFEKRGDKIISCCLVDGERIYTAGATNGHDWIDIVADLARENYNVWCTVDCQNGKIQALCSIAGLKIESKPEVIAKILSQKYGKSEKDIVIYNQNGLNVFAKKSGDGYPQVLLRS